MKAPLKDNIMSMLNRLIFPLLKNKFIKHFFVNLKSFIIKICSYKNVVNNFLQFLNLTWPVRYPDKVVFYIEIIETVFKNIFLIIFS